MKKLFLLCSAMLVAFGAGARENKPLDYSDRENWMIFAERSSADPQVDLFYLYPTCTSPECKSEIGEVDAHMKHMARLSYLKGASCMSPYTCVYAPYYRQISVVGILKAKNADDLESMCRDSIVKSDVFAALDFYFKNQNHGRPFILAGHSQGSCNLKIVLDEYMKAHPEYLKKMVACYAIGFHFPESWFKANPHVKKAAGETDTGVLISWNAELPGALKPNFCIDSGSFVINPLNWKTDETPAGIEQNLGSIEIDNSTLKVTFFPGQTGAWIDLKRGALICDGKELHALSHPLFGDKSLHPCDWSLFYRNVQENAQKRIEAFFKE